MIGETHGPVIKAVQHENVPEPRAAQEPRAAMQVNRAYHLRLWSKTVWTLTGCDVREWGLQTKAGTVRRPIGLR